MPNQAADQKKIQASSLSLPKGGGAIQGLGETFQANEFSGTANLSIPIFASPCRDFAPQLQLAYSSGNGNGPWGLGFSLSLPQITRQTRKGTPLYQETDIFVLSGSADLVPLDQTPRTQELQGITYTIQTFAPRQEGLFALIEYWQSSDPSQAFWKVTGKDHTISIFGKTNQAKIVDPSNPSHIFTWLLEESYNTTGDHQLFFYKQEDIDHVSDAIYEQNHVVGTNRYLARVQYGNEKPIADSIILNQSADPGIWHFEVVFDYGEYNIDPSNPNPYQPINKWALRPDPFSRYEAGFEIRTYRRCLHTLMFHRFPSELEENPVLVHATAYSYQANAGQLSECIAVTDTGYSYDSQQKNYTTASLPPLSLSYTPFNPTDQNFTWLTDEQSQGLSGFNEPPYYTLVDLFGSGIPGILYSEKDATYYREPSLSEVVIPDGKGPQPLAGATMPATPEHMHYAGWQVLNTFPIQREVAGTASVLLQDQTGNGQLDVVWTSPDTIGYWEAQPDHSWKSFQTLPAWPANFSAPGQVWVDVTGDGIADLVELTTNNVLVYPNIREQGMGSPLVQPKAPGMPASLESTPQEVIRFADMAGSGQSHLVRIRNGEVMYWPNLGYGRFGAPITMQNAPNFGTDFNPTQLVLADLDGSGTMDLIYLQSNQALIYLNQSGNAFSDPLILQLPVPFDDLNQITFADIYGRGNACLVLSEPHANPTPRYWCYDFCHKQKPYLLYKVDNNLGASTEVTYGSSVDFYLADKKAGIPWITPLPFPVQVIIQITHMDHIVGSRYVSQYAYHHGYYDGVEREFRGFGRVDRQDAEHFPPSQLDSKEDPHYVAPALSRTWYHTGAYLEDAALSRQYAQEYYTADSEAFAFPDSVMDWGSPTLKPDEETIRQAYVAMAGTVLRTELYGLDDKPQSIHPYTVSESNFVVKLRQPKGTHPYAIFYVYSQHSLSYTYERYTYKNKNNPDDSHVYHDPQINQSCVLQVDDYGNVERSCAIAYPRRPRKDEVVVLTEQQQLKVTCATQRYAAPQTTPEKYLIGVPIESQNHEITTLIPTPGEMLSFATLQKEIEKALATLSSTSPSSDQARLLGWGRSYYMQVDAQGTNTLLPLGQVTLPLLLGQHHVAEFSQEQVADALKGALEEKALQQKLEDGYYQFDETSTYWWNAGLTAQYFGANQFYLSSATIDPAGNQTTYAYDPYHLLMTQVTDALKNVVKIGGIDYQHLSPMQMIDVNGNTSETKLDPLGRVVYTSHYGHEAGKPVGFSPVSEAPKMAPASWSELITAIKQHQEGQYLGSMQSYFYYDPFAWQKRKEPVGSIALMAEQYPHSPIPNRIQIHLSYNDGLGRVLCSKSKVEPGEAFLYDEQTNKITTGSTEDRWLTSGRVVYNNKGKAVKQYEPYFINTPDYVSNPIIDTFGVSPTMYYDPLERVTHTITAKGYLLTHSWTSWEEVVSDANDIFPASPYCQVNVLKRDEDSIYYDPALSDADRAALAAVINNPKDPNLPKPSTGLGPALVYGVQYFANTPNRSIVDNLGNVIIAQITNKSQDQPDGELLCSYSTYDILGRQLTSADPRLHDIGKHNFITTYSLTGAVLKAISADAGTRWALSNILGNPLWSYDERQVTITPKYDVLHRPVEVHVHKNPVGEKDTLALDQIVERFVYGDTPGVVPNPEENNLKGQLYQHYDQAGLVTIPSYSLSGAPFSSKRQLRIDYKQEANWNDIDPNHLSSLLQSTGYEEKTEYDALGRATRAWDVDGNETIPMYHLSGLLDQIALTTAHDQKTKQVVQGITYNAKGQRLSISYDNSTTSTYAYDPKTWALANLKTVNTQGKILQDLVYVYDPADNVIVKTDNGQNTIYYNNQEVVPTATYTYDSLYRLIHGTGREKIGNTNIEGSQEVDMLLPTPHANNNVAIQNYKEHYTYDRSNNLVQIQHTAKGDSWTRDIIVAHTSNRAVISTINSDHVQVTPDQVDQYFDSHGNQIKTSQINPLAWNYRDNLQQVTTVKHTDGTYDGEYYVYDGSGQRIRKVHEQYGNNGQMVTFKETIYLGAVEYRRTLQGKDLATATVQEEYHSKRVMDDQQCVATYDYWKTGNPPTGIEGTSTWRYHLDDRLGSCTVEIDNKGKQISYEEYSPYGTSLLFIGTGSANQLKHYRYSGKERDSVTGFYYYGARYYAPWLARWLSPDPAGTVDGFNLYAFVTGNPETFWDVGGMGVAGSKSKKNNGDGDDNVDSGDDNADSDEENADSDSDKEFNRHLSNGAATMLRIILLEKMELLLRDGPIFIGEAHNETFAREVIMDLIKAGVVRSLFLELSHTSGLPDDNPQRKYGVREANYLRSINGDRERKDREREEKSGESLRELIKLTHDIGSGGYEKEFSIGVLIETALEQGGFPIYLHDVPKDVWTAKFWINNAWHDRRFAMSLEGMLARNRYSANIIAGIIRDENAYGEGTIVLAGNHHLDNSDSKDPIPEEDMLHNLISSELYHDILVERRVFTFKMGFVNRK